MSAPTSPSQIRFDIRNIANIAPPAMITAQPTRSSGGLPQITLPTGHTAVHLTRYGDVHRVLTDTSFIRSATNVDDGPSFLPTIMPEDMLLNLDHPDHGRLKRFVAAAYSANAMTALAPAVRRHTLSLVDDLVRALDQRADAAS